MDYWWFESSSHFILDGVVFGLFGLILCKESMLGIQYRSPLTG